MSPNSTAAQSLPMKPAPAIDSDHGRVKLPISISIPSTEVKTGLLKNYTCYIIKVNDFGRQVELQKRYDDFVKLHEGLMSIPSVSLPSLPPKQFFGGNDAKVIEERRPALEKYLRDCLMSPQVMSDEKECMHKFLDISHSGTVLVRYLSDPQPGLLSKLSELTRESSKSEKDNYRLFHDQVIHALLQVHGEDPTSNLELLQYILSKAYTHPLSSSMDVQSLFISHHGIHVVWRVLSQDGSVYRDLCRKTLSSLISSNMGHIEKFEKLFFDFVAHQKGLSLLFDTCDTEELHEITAKLVWFGLSESVQMALARDPQGLGLLGKFFASPDPHARCLAGLTLSVLMPVLDESKSARAMEGVASILSSFVTSTSSQNFPSQAVLSAVCRGSSRGIDRIKKVIESGDSPMSDFAVWVVQQAQLPFEFIEKNKLDELMENVVLNGQSDSVAMTSASLFLYRLYEEGKRLPLPRSDNRTSELLRKIQIGVSNHFEQTRKLISTEHTQYSEFQKFSIGKNFDRIKEKHEVVQGFSGDVFAEFVAAVDTYKTSYLSMEEKIGNNANLIKSLGEKISQNPTNGTWGNGVNGELLREWNQSLLGMGVVKDKLHQLQSMLSEKELDAKSAQNDANNLQQVISNMREELSNVDSRAEQFRSESSRFAAAASGAVNPEELIARAQENETKAKEEIAKREALRQSQDSLESQLAHSRVKIVESESRAAELRKAIAESNIVIQEAEMHHSELEKMLRAEMDALLLAWNEKLANNNASLAIVDNIVKNCDAINKLIESENDQKDNISGIIAHVVQQLQSLQIALSGA